MDTEQLLAPEDASPLGRTRTHVLDMLRAADGPLGVREVARRTGLHPNTARFHLEALTEARLAVRETEDRETPGRPRVGYRATAGGPAGRRRYRLLAEMLASLVAGTMPEPRNAAEEAGSKWGAYLTEQPPPYQKLTAEEAIGKLSTVMAEVGFGPQAGADEAGGQHRLRLRECPFREVAKHHQDVICSLHLGLMRGALAQMRAPVTIDRLDPLVEPSLCTARLTVHEDPASREERKLREEPPYVRDDPERTVATAARLRLNLHRGAGAVPAVDSGFARNLQGPGGIIGSGPDWPD